MVVVGFSLQKRTAASHADKRKRIMICQEEKERVSLGGERARNTKGKKSKKEGMRVNEGHSRNKHI